MTKNISLEEELLAALANKKPEEDQITLNLPKEKLLALSEDVFKDLEPELLPDTIPINISMKDLLDIVKKENPDFLKDLVIDLQLNK
jgi:hypothetical protein